MSIRGKKADNSDIHEVLEQESKFDSPISPEKIVFALDIGTRSVVGIVGIEEDGIFHIIDSEVMEHRSRAMLDGQIHHIAKVAEVVEIVKEKLESRLGFDFTKVAIAAAGRSLRTSEITLDKKIDARISITQEMINSLELEAIQLAFLKIREEYKDDDTNYYCIGHTVVNYYLNGYTMSNLAGHKGKEIGATVLATFLPHTVVDSLYSVVEKVGLKVSSLTLEPIAAINVSIPPDVRLLNIGLVDIGAGTSDIAITKDGSIVAYAMCSVAGDEITEKIAQHYLLDFNTAEKVKVQLQGTEELEFTDIMGIKLKVKSSEIIKIIEPAVENLVDIISSKIIECNGKSPNAVFCIGGGSLTPDLTKLLARKLGIQAERVGVRGTDIIKNIKFYNKKLKGPEAITPVGIAVTSLLKKDNDFMQVKVNKKKIELYNTGKLSIGDAIASSGFTPEQLIPRRGKAITFTLNGKSHTVRGGLGHPAEIFLNSEQASLDAKISNGDQIRVIPSEGGKEAMSHVEDFINNTEVKHIILNGNKLEITTKVMLNGKPTSLKQSIKEGDQLAIEEINTIEDLAKICEIDSNNFNILVNSQIVSMDYEFKNNDIVETVYIKTNIVTKNDSQSYTSQPNDINDTNYNENKILFDKKLAEDIVCAAKTQEMAEKSDEKMITVFINNDLVKLKGQKNYIFVDVFKYYDIDLNKNAEKIDLKLNGLPASYMDDLREGDIIEISLK